VTEILHGDEIATRDRRRARAAHDQAQAKAATR
jgi:hypothetical protein